MQISAIDVRGSCMIQSYRSGEPQGAPYLESFGSKYRKDGSSSPVVKGDHKHSNPWSFSIQESGDITGRAVLYEAGGWSTQRDGIMSGCDSARSLLLKANASDPYNKALSKLYEKIRSDTDLSIDIYQGGQTVRMLKDLASALTHPVRTLAGQLGGLVRKKKIRRGSSLISNKWLEWQYGIRPTLATIHTLTSEMIELISDDQGFYMAKARASSFESFPAILPAGSWSSVYKTNLSGDHSRRSEIEIHYGIGDTDRYALSQFTSLNPVSFIYENIPFSFVLDWVVDVGGYLRNMETALMAGLEFRSGRRTDTSRKSVIATIDDVASSSGRTYIAKGTGWAVEKTLNRSLLAKLPRPQTPVLNISLGSQRLFSAASLLRGFIR